MTGVDEVGYVGERYQELATLLYDWGYDLASTSGWDPAGIADPLTGLVRLKGNKTLDELTVGVRFTEHWQIRGHGSWFFRRSEADCVLYHYHGQIGRARSVRFCLFHEGHPEMPYHWHPTGDSRIEPYDPVTPYEALEAIETIVYENCTSADGGE